MLSSEATKGYDGAFAFRYHGSTFVCRFIDVQYIILVRIIHSPESADLVTDYFILES